MTSVEDLGPARHAELSRITSEMSGSNNVKIPLCLSHILLERKSSKSSTGGLIWLYCLNPALMRGLQE